jgi:hypothetical protein
LLRGTQAAAPALGVQVIPSMVDSRAEIERAIDEFGKESNGGLIGLPGNPTQEYKILEFWRVIFGLKDGEIANKAVRVVA